MNTARWTCPSCDCRWNGDPVCWFCGCTFVVSGDVPTGLYPPAPFTATLAGTP